MNQLDCIAKEYLAARDIIRTALGEWYGGSPDRLNFRAVAILASLAAHDPPILLEMQEAEPDSLSLAGGEMSWTPEGSLLKHEPDPDDLDPVFCHRCDEYCTEPRVEVDGVWMCPSCVKDEYTGPRCSHCTEPVSAATGRQQPLYSGVWLCDACMAAAEREWDRKREER